ncbi:hypothetical protein MCSF7_00151 [Mycoplasmopsis columbina SF7]|uniref:Uncharacterized protein n=1 Tax=Mycoplasmopsis columbina SF7 TaxID=1037410 RepID=F9UJI5_9BACT|nr:hypothetical protein [Mycoplasmopsis columbina]EGV00366.1 hypothetical protein MCSF7_00151 [Mycoplasmopsis columbina SF7]
MENKTYKNEKNREINEFSLDLLVRIKSGRLKKDHIKEGQEIKNDNILEKLFWNNSSSFNLESYKLKTSFLNKLFSLEKQNSVKTYNNPIVKAAYFNEIDNNKNSFKVFFKGTKEKNYDDQLKFDFIINHLALLEIKAADFFIFKVNLSFRELNKNYSIVDVQHFLNSFNSFNKKTEKYSFEINNKLENSLFDFFRWLLKKSFAIKSPEFVFWKKQRHEKCRTFSSLYLLRY